MDGLVAIVTGADRGIGQRIAERFAAEGAAVAGVARIVDPRTSVLPGSISDVAEPSGRPGMTPGVRVVSPHTTQNAALELCSAPVGTVTDRVTYSMDVLGRPFREERWVLSATF